MLYSFCESVTASSSSKWHIRPLTDAGQKFYGGIDTNSLCGHVTIKIGGWDNFTPVTENDAKRECPNCFGILFKKVKI